MRGPRPAVAAWLAAVLSLGGLIAPGSPATGAPPQTTTTPGLRGEVVVVRLAGRPARAELRVRGRPVARLSGATARQRLETAARRLARPLLPPVVVAVTARRRAADLVVDGTVVLSAERLDASRDGTDPPTLARRWARALEDALAIPPIAVSPSSLVLAPAGVGVARVSTAIPGRVIIGSFDPEVVEVTLRRDEVRVTGRRLGSTIVPLRFGPYRADVAVSVRPPAGTVPWITEVIVTGTQAPPALVREAVERRLFQVVQRRPGATVVIGPVAVPGPVAPGASVPIPVAVSVRSPYGAPVDGTVIVTVTNTPLRLGDPDVLLVSNRPETITANGRLFQETLTAGRPARFLFHHMNGDASQPRVLKITLNNPGGARARVHYLAGLAGPSPDPLQIGHQATSRFLTALTAGQGYMVEVPPRSATAFEAYTLAPRALVSGLMQFQVVEGGPVDLTVHVRVPWLLDGTVTVDLGPWAFPHPRGTFPGSVVEVARELLAHQPAPVADLGVMSGLRDVRTGEPLVGDYGVLYRLRLRLVNPTDREVTTMLVANAAGGPARGLFLINGAAVDAGLLQPNEERAVTSFAVAAGSARDVVILTMPIAGSFYPVRLAVRPR
ncbi:MAG: hypothetical protein HY355_05055 [Armatimonadetes bacterium]|nr:hypothetical protein [Armatimonadota bacterium]